jgi:hypothetical protein
MTQKTLKISYWTATAIFALFLLMDGAAGVIHEPTGVGVMQHLGYPVYLLSIVGVAKLLAAIAILQTKFKTIKEWAFAGFAISCVGAFWSRAAVGDGVDLIYPIVFFAIMLVPYVLWKKYRVEL